MSKETHYYTCEICGERFDTEEAADACEEKHAEERAARKKETTERKEAEKLISDLVNKYIEKYGKYPLIRIEKSDSIFDSIWF